MHVYDIKRLSLVMSFELFEVCLVFMLTTIKNCFGCEF